MFSLLLEDVKSAKAAVEKDGQDSAKRSLFRALFAFIEGIVYQIKQVVLAHRGADVTLTSAERVFLNEEDYDLNEKGHPHFRKRNISLVKNLKFAFTQWAEIRSSGFKLEVDGEGWESFIKAIRIRDRLMHPKSLNDLHITDKELEIADKTLKWFFDSYAMSLAHNIVKLGKIIKELKDKTAALERDRNQQL